MERSDLMAVEKPDFEKERRDRAIEAIRSAVSRKRDISNARLMDIAADFDPSVAKISPRQFHGRYVLVALRQLARGRPRKNVRRGAKQDGRSNIEQVLLRLARDVAKADRAGLVEIIAQLDKYVDEITTKF